MKNAVESCGGIAFANGKEEPGKGREGRLAMPRRAMGRGRALLAAAFAAAVGTQPAIASVFRKSFPVFLSAPRIGGALTGTHES